MAAKLEQERLDGELAARLSLSNNDREVGQVAEGFLESLAVQEATGPQQQETGSEGVTLGVSELQASNGGLQGDSLDASQPHIPQTRIVLTADSTNPGNAHENDSDDLEAGAPLQRSLEALGLNEETGFPVEEPPRKRTYIRVWLCARLLIGT